MPYAVSLASRRILLRTVTNKGLYHQNSANAPSDQPLFFLVNVICDRITLVRSMSPSKVDFMLNFLVGHEMVQSDLKTGKARMDRFMLDLILWAFKGIRNLSFFSIPLFSLSCSFTLYIAKRNDKIMVVFLINKSPQLGGCVLCVCVCFIYEYHIFPSLSLSFPRSTPYHSISLSPLSFPPQSSHIHTPTQIHRLIVKGVLSRSMET